MQHGSVVPHKPPSSQLPVARRQETLALLKSTASLGHGISSIAQGCINEGHITVDHADHIYELAMMMQAKLDQLYSSISDT